MVSEGMKRIILTTADLNYFKVVRVFLASLRYNKNDYTVRLDFINGTEAACAELKLIYPKLEINTISIVPTEDKDKNLLAILWTRPPQMWKAMNEDWDQILLMDCDVVVRGSIAGIWDNVEPSTFKILYKKEKSNNTKTCTQSGVHIYGNSETIREYYKRIMDRAGAQFAFWDVQRAMYEIYLEFKDKIKFVPLDRKYNDDRYKELRQDSLVWHIKHGRINMDTPFKREFERYSRIADGYANVS